MRIIVLGGAGAMGRITVRALTEYPDIEQIIIADYDEARARKLASSLEATRVVARQVDVTNETQLRSLLQGCTVALNAADYRFNTLVMQACLAERIHYADLGGLFHVSRQQLDLHSAAQQAGITAILGIGGTPGITNLLARAAVDQLDQVDSIKVQLGCSDQTPSNAALVAPYSIRTILDEFTKEPQVYQDGAWIAQRPLSGQEILDFPPPVGKATAIYSLHSECATFPLSFREKGLRHVSFKIAFPGDFVSKLTFLVELGFGKAEPIKVQGVQVSPREVLARLLELEPAEEVEPQDCDVLRVVVTGRQDNQPVQITNQVVALPYTPWSISAGALDTGVPLAIAGHMLGQGTISSHGAFGPEVCIPVAPFFAELAHYNLHMTSQSTKL
ncbi:saccharopine dehydrogenase family protein [Dictyobacter kobayashii]|uniref:Putative saccharopine dehydrogenase n=1 Tax=Dictyobacter kobayashii TaxID=2014872 RepID=A0A402AT89_9CHLR|nr:saccharopine dehydrogenase NADP-binding domain-containing protein [Dictyobacter kobayashii]GCE22328.1 putative saccharopine dehydrogenase [Dictyobacter kobayashii]